MSTALGLMPTFRAKTSAAGAIRTASFLGAIHTPCSRRDDRDPGDHVCRPFLCGFFGTNTSVACQHFTVNTQRHIARAKDDPLREEAINSYIVHYKCSCLRV